MRLRWALTVVLAFLVAPAPSTAAASDFAFVVDGDVIVVVRRTVAQALGITKDEMRAIAGWARTSLETYRKAGFDPPKLLRYRGRWLIGISGRETGKLGHANGVYRRSNGLLLLNARNLRDTGAFPWDQGRPVIQGTVAHELYHAVQSAYDDAEDEWLYEATAASGVQSVFPDHRAFFSWELLHSARPDFPFHGRMDLDDKVNLGSGRPYGASAFFRFLDAYGPSNASRRIWEACRTTPGPNAWRALADVLGDADVLGTRFRAYFDRFRVGTFLLEDAPPGSKIPDAALYAKRNGRPIRPPREDLAAAVAAHWSRLATNPADPAVDVRVRLSGMATKYAVFRAPVGAPLGSWFDVRLVPADPAVTLQAVVHTDGRWTVLPGSAKAGGPLAVTIPDLSRTKGTIVIVATRYELLPGFVATPRDAFKSFQLQVQGHRSGVTGAGSGSVVSASRIWLLRLTGTNGGKVREWYEPVLVTPLRPIQTILAERRAAVGTAWQASSVEVFTGPHATAPDVPPMTER
jgi:hypothetical protein